MFLLRVASKSYLKKTKLCHIAPSFEMVFTISALSQIANTNLAAHFAEIILRLLLVMAIGETLAKYQVKKC